jgi:hypothetical protein
MSAKHTPGPWEFVPAGNTPVVQQAGIFPHGFICNVASLNFVADARLIAAAPDMLEALKKAEQFIRNGIELGYIRMPEADTLDTAHDTPPMVRAAIAKAEGQP